MGLESVSTYRSHGGVQGIYKHASAVTGTDMTFSVFVPEQKGRAGLPVVWFQAVTLQAPPPAAARDRFRFASRRSRAPGFRASGGRRSRSKVAPHRETRSWSRDLSHHPEASMLRAARVPGASRLAPFRTRYQ